MKKTKKKYGQLLIFEGPDYSGKSTVINSLMEYYSDNLIENKLQYFSEPLHPIKQLITNKDKFDKVFKLDSDTAPELNGKSLIDYYLFMASRVSVLNSAIAYYKKGYIVLVDRSFPSTMIYQGYDFGTNRPHFLNFETIYNENMNLIDELACLNKLDDYSIPTCMIFLDYSVETIHKRMKARKTQNSFDPRTKKQIEEQVYNYEYIYNWLNNQPRFFNRLLKYREGESIYQLVNNIKECDAK